jgi:hypothetical protein
MNKLAKTVVLAGIALGVLAAPSWAGTTSYWTTDFGSLDMSVNDHLEVSGKYPHYQGTIKGRMTVSGKITAYWLQPNSSRRCGRSVYGNWHWGIVVWQVLNNGDLSGSWSYCEDRVGSGGTWSGRLTRGPSPLSLVGQPQPPKVTKSVPAPTPAPSSTGDEAVDAFINLLDALAK